MKLIFSDTTQERSWQIAEMLRLEQTSWDHVGQTPCSSRVSCRRLPRTMPSQVFNTPTDGDFTTSLGNLPQCLTTLIVKKCFLRWSNKRLPRYACDHQYLDDWMWRQSTWQGSWSLQLSGRGLTGEAELPRTGKGERRPELGKGRAEMRIMHRRGFSWDLGGTKASSA